MTREEAISKGEKYIALILEIQSKLLNEEFEGTRTLQTCGHFILVVDNKKPEKLVVFDDDGKTVEIRDVCMTSMNLAGILEKYA